MFDAPWIAPTNLKLQQEIFLIPAFSEGDILLKNTDFHYFQNKRDKFRGSFGNVN